MYEFARIWYKDAKDNNSKKKDADIFIGLFLVVSELLISIKI